MIAGRTRARRDSFCQARPDGSISDVSTRHTLSGAPHDLKNNVWASIASAMICRIQKTTSEGLEATPDSVLFRFFAAGGFHEHNA
ncbi:MAG: hypothetical protein DYG94_05880 [Leptolyngbya sp. PLA3]|nr:MAG: hypothetical protein EDM82_03690 [Cyanobacteria bacterium CYA]MCE7968258.1 hypothetical protein [Leptolyngbya sp. PL-A3]